MLDTLQSNFASKPLTRRRALSLAVLFGASATVAVNNGVQTASAALPARSLDGPLGSKAEMTIIGTEPSRVIKRYSNVFSSVPNVSPHVYRDAAGRLKVIAACNGATNQLQQFDVSSKKLDFNVSPLPNKNGGIDNIVFGRESKTIIAYGSGEKIKQVSSSGDVSDAFTIDRDASTSRYQPSTDSQGRIWSGSYPSGNATRFDPATGRVLHGPRLSPDTQYVRALAVDSRDRVFAGTGTKDPAMFTWHTNDPEAVERIPLPNAATTGFVHHIESHGGLVFVYYDARGGGTEYRIWDPELSQWRSKAWPWMPAGRLLASNRDASVAYAVWNTVGVHKLMRIDTRTLAATYICNVPFEPDSLQVEASGSDSIVHIVASTSTLVLRHARVSVAGRKVVARADFKLQPSVLGVRALTAHGEKLYFGGFLGDGIGSLDVSTGRLWRSSSTTGIQQIEGMLSHSKDSLCVGSYRGAELFRFDPLTNRTSRIHGFGSRNQDRPFAWASAAGKAVAGMAPAYGTNGGGLASVDPKNIKTIKYHGTPVPGQSVVGLVGSGDIAYGTTSRLGGLGSKLDAKSAHVFAYNIRTGRLLWKRAFAGEDEINSPILVGSVLYVSTVNGIVRVNTSTGSPVATYKVLNRAAPAGYTTTKIVYLKRSRQILHMVGGTTTLIDPRYKTQKVILSGSYDQPVVTPSGRLFCVSDGTDIVEVDTVQRPTIHSAADLISVRTNGALYVTRSLGNGAFAPPLRADYGFGTNVRSVNPVLWNDDGVRDVVTTHSDGTLRMHRGRSTGGFAAPSTLSTGKWHHYNVAVGTWGGKRTVMALDRISGILTAYQVQTDGKLSKGTRLATGWKNRYIVLMKPSRSSSDVIVARQGSSLYRYSRVSGGKPAARGVRIGTGFGKAVTFSPVSQHRDGSNGIAWIDSTGKLRYNDVAVNSIGATRTYDFPMATHKLASSTHLDY